MTYLIAKHVPVEVDSSVPHAILVWLMLDQHHLDVHVRLTFIKKHNVSLAPITARKKNASKVFAQIARRVFTLIKSTMRA